MINLFYCNDCCAEFMCDVEQNNNPYCVYCGKNDTEIDEEK